MAPGLRVGYVVVSDNLAMHMFADVREATEAAGASVYYLPPCNLGLNPIAQVFQTQSPAAQSAGAHLAVEHNQQPPGDLQLS